MTSPARSTAYDVLCRVELSGAHSDELLNAKLLEDSDERDRNLATDICYGVLRWRAALDDVLNMCSARPWESVDERVRILLRMSLYQLRFTDRIPDHALVNDAVEIAKSRIGRGCAGFVNGVLRALARERPWEKDNFDATRPDWIRASLPRWLWDRWSARWGREVAFRYALSLNRPPQGASWRCFPSDEVTNTDGIAQSFVPGAELIAGKAGDHSRWTQDEASQLVAHLMGRLDGKKLWDACAAPGGKTGILDLLTGNEGLVIASDVSFKRAKRMKGALIAAGRNRTVVLVADARSPAPFKARSFDAALADVPCSGLGTLRKNPEIKWRLNPDRLQTLQSRQLAILCSVSGAVRPGGTVLYATCSTEPEENEQVLDAFLEGHPDFRLVRPANPSGVEGWVDSRGVLRTFPSERLWDGFFAALIVRFHTLTPNLT